MRQEMHVVVLLRLAHQRIGRRIDVAAHPAGLDRLHGGALDLLDLAQQVLELGIGLAVDRHAAEIADIAVVIAAGVERQDVARLPALLGGRAVEAGARRDQAIFENEPAVGLLAPQRFGQRALGGAGAVARDHRQHGVDHGFRVDPQLLELLRALARAHALEHEHRVHDLAAGKCLAQRAARIHRQEAELGPDAARLGARLADMVDRLLHHVDRAGRRGLRLAHPEGIVLLLEAFQPVAEIGRPVGRALGIDEDRQVAAEPHRVHVVEKEGAVAAEQILHIVLGGREQQVDAGLLHQKVEPVGVERNGAARWCGGVEHDSLPCDADVMALPGRLQVKARIADWDTD